MTQTARPIAKITAGVVGGLIGFCIGPFLGGVAGALVGGLSEGPWPSQVGGAVGMGAGAIGGALLVGRPVVAGWCLGTAFALGAVSFLAGFAGPILLSPDSPQGPLLGIFITGPLGFVVGAVIGLWIGLTKERHQFGRGPA
jgi:hypothetical protein